MEVSQFQSPPHSDRNSNEEYPAFLDFRNIQTPRHKWTGPQRELLCVLRRFYALPKKEEALIFNYLFETEIEGFRNGLPVTSVNTQWHDMAWRKHPIWISVNSIFLSNDEYRECRHIIELAAAELGLHLCCRDCDDGQTNPKYPGFHLLQSFFHPRTDVDLQSNPPSAADADHDHDEPEPDIEPERECGARFKKASMRLRYDGTQQKPQILYRFFNSQSRGTNSSRYFASGLTSALHPSLYNQRDIEAMAKTHLSRYEVSSPFISTFATLLPCVHRMLTQGQNARVSIIDVSKVDQNGIFSAQDILRKDPLSTDITPGYCGWSEWLIWGEIPESSIVCTIAEPELLEIAEIHPDIGSVLQIKDIKSFTYNRGPLHQRLKNSPTKLDKPAGVIVGKFFKLINLPVEYIEQVAIKISHGWRFTRTSRYARYDEFLDGVHLGYANSASVPSSDNTLDYATPPITPEKSGKSPEVIVIDDDNEYEQEVVVIEDDEEEMEVVVIEDDEAEMEVVVVEDEEQMEELEVVEVDEANYELEDQIINQEEKMIDRFQEELRRTIESESEIAEEITSTQNAATIYRWELVDVEMGDAGNEIAANIFELDRERVNRMMGW
ncbi:hypothetical protein EMCG_02581 [[Emmonsia] crescens]|uniref:DUF7587 domain-containing protein n=1 Tax=[Emmonsia] crescens TaxID=73230 RepID=A0A0G2HZ30_9EURO|nr:hypothetical protein EMCG_02581 [Emmonsia crescens UAMH 3008]